MRYMSIFRSPDIGQESLTLTQDSQVCAVMLHFSSSIESAVDSLHKEGHRCVYKLADINVESVATETYYTAETTRMKLVTFRNAIEYYITMSVLTSIGSII